MTSADPMVPEEAPQPPSKPARRGRRAQSGLADRLSPQELEDSFEEALDAVAGEVDGIEPSPEVLDGRPLFRPSTEDAPPDGFYRAEDGSLVAGSVRTVEIYSQSDGTELLPNAGGKPRKYELVENGLVFAPKTSYEDWARDTLGLIQVKKRIDWALADALAFGEDVYGEQASQLLDDTPFSIQTLWNLASIARRVPRELRNDRLPFTVQAEVASLPYADQKALLERAAEEGMKREEVRDAVRKLKRERKQEEAERKPEPATTPPNLYFCETDARETPWATGSMNLIVTSPPYGIMDEGMGVRKYDTPDDWQAWAELMDDFAEEAYRLLAPGGRIVLNVPFDTWVGGENGGQRNTYARALLALQSAGLTYVTTIHWDEGNVSKSVARGSVDSPSSPRVMNRFEALIVMCKGPYGRLDDMKTRDLTTDLTHEEWLDWTNGHWVIPGESNAWEGFEAAFPPELARRAIALFSFKEDIVCDPFVGSGTTAYVCWRLGRTGYFGDLDPKRIASSKRRVQA